MTIIINFIIPMNITTTTTTIVNYYYSLLLIIMNITVAIVTI